MAAWQARPHDARPLVLMDFDGTLAEFENDPAAVTLPESRQLLLQSLGRRSDLSSGIVSGRRITELRERIPGSKSMFFAGLHGLEIEGPDLRFMHNAVAFATPAIAMLAKDLRRAVKPLPGVFVEDKILSIVLHTRGASPADRLHATTSSTSLITTPSFNCLSRSHRPSPSTKSMAGAPSRVASRRASGVKEPVVMTRPLSARPTMAPRKSRITGAPTKPLMRLDWNSTWKESRLTRRTPVPSMPPSPDRPVTSTLVKPDSRNMR